MVTSFGPCVIFKLSANPRGNHSSCLFNGKTCRVEQLDGRLRLAAIFLELAIEPDVCFGIGRLYVFAFLGTALQSLDQHVRMSESTRTMLSSQPSN